MPYGTQDLRSFALLQSLDSGNAVESLNTEHSQMESPRPFNEGSGHGSMIYRDKMTLVAKKRFCRGVRSINTGFSVAIGGAARGWISAP